MVLQPEQASSPDNPNRPPAVRPVVGGKRPRATPIKSQRKQVSLRSDLCLEGPVPCVAVGDIIGCSGNPQAIKELRVGLDELKDTYLSQVEALEMACLQGMKRLGTFSKFEEYRMILSGKFKLLALYLKEEKGDEELAQILGSSTATSEVDRTEAYIDDRFCEARKLLETIVEKQL